MKRAPLATGFGPTSQSWGQGESRPYSEPHPHFKEGM